MPTIGWIREDALEAFYENTERLPDFGPPPRRAYPCPFCSAIFDAEQNLQAHIASEHKVERPILLIQGREPGRRITVRTQMAETDIFPQNATSIAGALNGGTSTNLSLETLGPYLASHTDAELSLSFINDGDKNTTPLVSKYDLSFRVATADQLRNVERAFHEIVMNGEMTRASLGLFLEDTRAKGVANEYATGLAEYSLGVLLKERPETEPLTTPFAKYREAYDSSLHLLSDFDRPMAKLISNLIRFARNDFSAWNIQTGYWELDLANSVLHCPESKTIDELGEVPVARTPICPVDHGTGRLLALTKRMIGQDRWGPILDEECRDATSADILDGADRQKALAVWAAAAWRLGAKERAIEPLRQIEAIYPFSEWAKPYLESVRK